MTFTATVTAVAPGSGTPTGTVTFMDGATTLGTATLNGRRGTFTTSTLAVGAHSITAVYGGDGNFNAQHLATALEPGRRQKADHDDGADLVGQPVDVRPVGDVHGDGRRVPPGAGTPTGTVTFKDGATTLGTGTLERRRGDLRHRRARASAPTRSPPSTAATPTSTAAPRPRSARWSTRRDTTTALDLVGQPVGVRPVGDVHGDGDA